MAELAGKRVAMLLAKDFEDSEATDPKQYLETRGAEVVIVGLDRQPITGKKGTVLQPDKTIDEVTVEEFDALVIPGGGSPENLRIDDRAVAFTRAFVESGKPVAAICHGPQLLISADVLRGRTVTCVKKIRDDVKNAGAIYVDEAVVIDGNLITSRVPADLPLFDQAIAEALARVPARGD
ncbi:type 1 glutamine amidotransferase domain-containing protein [Thermomicrobium sp.]|jgi:protease I|uniref:type 1 glutamine amidotransferase domain-containing protein n=1 Tax=Thermomicrobium sp. TaxID=1969469 RepID=UPI001B18DF87|nr:type 1 glutamine amidotransferase domain-containing protein [Thermomicrobium sp.]MBO9307889.1 type 1 glutamine amidotransferase [Thermomicrobium sp.]MBO9352295.1 type 1 glutamine amidotransferase [Thermomicrobium sp.]MBO9386873.1 type 1 glutamine amidotransferase [Thermomicrobium sp.]